MLREKVRPFLQSLVSLNASLCQDGLSMSRKPRRQFARVLSGKSILSRQNIFYTLGNSYDRISNLIDFRTELATNGKEKLWTYNFKRAKLVKYYLL